MLGIAASAKDGDPLFAPLRLRLLEPPAEAVLGTPSLIGLDIRDAERIEMILDVLVELVVLGLFLLVRQGMENALSAFQMLGRA